MNWDVAGLLEYHDGFTGACGDLAYLTEHDALAGVAEVIAERRRQVEQGATAGQDDQLRHGELVAYAERRIRLGKLRQAAALLAAEIDRIGRQS